MNTLAHPIVIEGDNKYVQVPYDEYMEMFCNVNDALPHEVVSIMVDHQCGFVGAWRRYRGMTQTEVAKVMGITQPAYSQIEKSGRPQLGTRKKLADIFDVSVEQLTE
jgi:DNA-binding XRE family transcriptional regulator